MNTETSQYGAVIRNEEEELQTDLRARFKDASWFNLARKTDVVIGGAGGIGSWLTLMLSRAGLSCYVFDMDTVETHNIGGQLYSVSDIGSWKVHALRDLVLSMSGKLISSHGAMYNNMSSSVMASCFDNMEARRQMFDAWKEYIDYNNTEGIFIDGRLGAEHMEIYCVTPGREELYEQTLFASHEAPDEACTMKQTSHAAAMIASHMTAFITNWLSNLIDPDSRELPFSWKYHIPLNLLTSETP